MDLNFISQLYIPIVLVICLCVGYVISKFVPMDNKWIPTIMLVLGVVLGCVANKNFELTTIAAGAVTGLASTGLHQVFKQLIESGKLYSGDESRSGEVRDDIEVKDTEAK